MNLRPRSSVSYSNDGTELTDATIGSTSKWNADTVESLNIVVVNTKHLFSDFLINPPKSCIDNVGISNEQNALHEDARQLIITEWKDGNWLQCVDVKSLLHTNKVKTLINKIKRVHVVNTNVAEMMVDGFMDSLLHILRFDDFPCSLYPQYEYVARIGRDNRAIKAKPDFSVLSESFHMLLVIEDKTVSNATYANSWKEDQVLGKLFVAVHNIAASTIKYPITLYAVRVVGILFTFYKATATLEYIKESAKGNPTRNALKVERYPPVEDSPMLTAYDICKYDDRLHILQCMCSIRQFIILE